jgi:hypothetical protein
MKICSKAFKVLLVAFILSIIANILSLGQIFAAPRVCQLHYFIFAVEILASFAFISYLVTRCARLVSGLSNPHSMRIFICLSSIGGVIYIIAGCVAVGTFRWYTSDSGICFPVFNMHYLTLKALDIILSITTTLFFVYNVTETEKKVMTSSSVVKRYKILNNS